MTFMMTRVTLEVLGTFEGNALFVNEGPLIVKLTYIPFIIAEQLNISAI